MQTPLERIADFDLTDEQRQVRGAVREFAEKEIAPHVERHEREERYPLELIRKLVPLGYIAPMIPERYGGSFSDVVTYGIICEELARVDWVIASVVSVTNSLVAGSILRHGSEAQKERWLPRIARGEMPHLGVPDRAGRRHRPRQPETTATRVDGRLAARRHQGLHLARRPRGSLLRGGDDRPREEAPRRDRLPGRPEDAGHRASASSRCARSKRDNLAEVHFEDVFVPDEALLGEPGKGFPVLGSALDMGRYSVAARCVGQAQRCLDLALPYAHAARGLRPAHRRVPADPAEDRGDDLPHRGGARRSSTSSGA